MLYKTTTRLFRGTYQYKIVLVCVGASLFRSGDIAVTMSLLRKVDIESNKKRFGARGAHIRSQDDLDYALRLATCLEGMKDIEVRVESPWVSVYTNNKNFVDALVDLDKSRVKYVSLPPDNTTLVENTIIMPKIDYDYRVTLGKTNHENSAFIEWAEANPKLKLTKGCKTELQRNQSWGGRHFYVTGDNNLLLTRMHLGGSIAKVERIVKK